VIEMNTVQRIAKNTGAKGKGRKGNGYKGGPKFKEFRVEFGRRVK